MGHPVHKHTMQVSLTEGSVYLQHNVMLYIQKSVSENAGNCSHRGRKIQKFSGGEYPRPPPPPILLNAIPHQTFCYQQTIYHFSTLGIVWSLFVDAPNPPTDEFLKNALQMFNTCIHSYLFVSHSRLKNTNKILKIAIF